ncbi:lipoprotein, putative [[Synechococcus] sp. NIES-970]|nr:lipoprotein, putative [[Synechococcus] sp. NIES-970]
MANTSSQIVKILIRYFSLLSVISTMKNATIVSITASAFTAIALTGCTLTLDAEKLETEISQGLTDQTGLVATDITCPEDQAIEAGNVFACEATLEGGQTLPIQVTQNDDEGNVNWNADEGLNNLRGLISAEALETQIAQGIVEQLGIETTIDCGGPYRVLLTGESFECTATANDGNGESATVQVTAEDDEGNVAWSLN